MRKYFLLALLGYLSVYNPVQAQLEKGTGYLGATIGLSGSNISQKSTSTYSINGIGISPSLSVGKFVKNNFLLGINVGTVLDFRSTKQNEQKYRSNTIVYFANPFIRNYKTIGNSSKWAVFLTSSAKFALTEYKNKPSLITSKRNAFATGLEVKPGIAYWITPHFSLESDINLLSLETGYNTAEGGNSFYFRSGATSSLNGYFSVRAAWYIQKQ